MFKITGIACLNTQLCDIMEKRERWAVLVTYERRISSALPDTQEVTKRIDIYPLQEEKIGPTNEEIAEGLVNELGEEAPEEFEVLLTFRPTRGLIF